MCQGYWNRIGQDVMSFLEQSKENSPWYEGSRVAVPILDATFRSRMERLLGNMVQRKDLESPRSIVEVRSMMCLDVASY